MPKLAILIVSWNTRQLLAACLDSIARTLAEEGDAFAAGAVETIVVDNASHDGSAAMLRQEYAWVRLLENQENIGFAAANNQAWRASTGDYVLLLNPDTVLRPQALATLVAFMDAHPEAGAAGSRLLNPDGSLQPSCSPAPTLARELWRLLHLDRLRPYGEYAMHQWPTTQARLVDNVQGAAMIVRRALLTQVGFLDTDYFMYSEEVDLCYRIRSTGQKIYWVPQSQVVHYGGQSTQQAATAMFLQLYHSKVLYFRKRQGWFAAQLYKVVLLVAALARLALVPLATRQDGYRRARQMTLAGHYLQLVRHLHKL